MSGSSVATTKRKLFVVKRISNTDITKVFWEVWLWLSVFDSTYLQILCPRIYKSLPLCSNTQKCTGKLENRRLQWLTTINNLWKILNHFIFSVSLKPHLFVYSNFCTESAYLTSFLIEVSESDMGTVWNSLPDHLLDPAVDSGQFRRELKMSVCSPDIRNVSTLEVLHNRSLQINIYLLPYLHSITKW